MNTNEALLAMKETHRQQMQSTLSCIEMFMENPKQCGCPDDASLVKWIAGKLKDDKRKSAKLFAEYERLHP